MGKQLTWYYNRLRAMSVPEVLHRVQEMSKRKAGRKFSAEDFAVPAHVTFSPLAIDDAALAEVATTQAAEWRKELEKAQAGNWTFLGVQWDNTPMEDLWHHDPVSGRAWPSEPYCYDINYRHDDSRGDIKFVWEMNRLQILPMAAALARCENDAEARTFVIETLDSWNRANPVFKGVNWASGIELALRIINISVALSLLDPKTLDPAFLNRVMCCLNAHLFWLHRYPSKHSSANNHLISELAACYVLARLAPDLPAARNLAEPAWQGLMEEALRQIHPDGVGAEQSPTYTCFTLEWYLMALAVADQSGDELPGAVCDRLGNAAEVLRWMMDDNGNVPRIGDDDQGRVLLSGDAREADYVPQILAALCARLNRPELSPPSCAAHLRHVWTGCSAGENTRPLGTRNFDDGGYSVLRHEMAGRNSMIAMDHGPLGYLSIAAHGHADALSIWWHLDGQPVLVDCGTYLYHSGGAERDAFRGTALHNTLQFGDMHQSQVSGAFNWSRKANAKRLSATETKDGDAVQAIHDGYQAQGVTHERKLMMNVPNGYLIRDRLLGAAKEPDTMATLSWHFHPDLQITIAEDNSAVIAKDGQPLATLRCCLAEDDFFDPKSGNVKLRLSERPYSPAFGVKVKTQAITHQLPASSFGQCALLSEFKVVGA